MVQNNGGRSQWLIYANAANLRIEDMTQISKINSLVLTVYATGANMCINVKGNVPGGMTMDDLVYRKELRDALYEADAVTMQGVKIINQLPAVDAVEVVRCRNCKYGDWDSKSDDAMVCMRTKDGFWRSGNDFCSYGKRKDGDGNAQK